jgi:hypothetical protein
MVLTKTLCRTRRGEQHTYHHHTLSGKTAETAALGMSNKPNNATNTAMSDTNETPPAEETPESAPVPTPETEAETQEIPPTEAPAETTAAE